jgi:hypothetical protein
MRRFRRRSATATEIAVVQKRFGADRPRQPACAANEGALAGRVEPDQHPSPEPLTGGDADRGFAAVPDVGEGLIFEGWGCSRGIDLAAKLINPEKLVCRTAGNGLLRFWASQSRGLLGGGLLGGSDAPTKRSPVTAEFRCKLIRRDQLDRRLGVALKWRQPDKSALEILAVVVVEKQAPVNSPRCRNEFRIAHLGVPVLL